MPDIFAQAKIASAQKWGANNKASISNSGIAESNLFLMLAAAGLSGDLFGQRLFPIGTLYDPFIARGLDALNYACYQDARFLLVATPSGITLGPEGGAHQSINPPLIALGQPGLRHYEPAYADELAAMMEEAFRLIDDPDGREHLPAPLDAQRSSRSSASDDGWRERRSRGRLLAARAPAQGAEAAIVAMGAVMPEALAAWEELQRRRARASACSPSPRRICSTAAGPRRRRRDGRERKPSHVEQLASRLLAATPASSRIADAAPASLSWLGGVLRPARRAAWASRGSARPAASPISMPPLPARRRCDHAEAAEFA